MTMTALGHADPYKYICRNLVIPLWAWWEGSGYLRLLSYLDKSQYFDPQRVREIQWEQVTRLLAHAYQNSPFYRSRFDREGMHPSDIRSWEDFSRIPLLTKQDVYSHREELIAPNVDRYYSFLTSGSTGMPLKGFWNKECAEFKRACGRRSEFWAGYRLGERAYCLYGDPERERTGLKKIRARFRRKFLLRTEVLDMLNLTEDSMRRFALRMRQKPPSLLWGHAHGLYLLARFIERERIDGIRPKGMYSAGMVLHDHERAKVEEVFKCALQDRYGCEEVGLIATECKEKAGLHINTDSHYVEFLAPDGSPARPGESGAIVITDMKNYVMPFIRYRLEDVCVPSDRTCPCGRTQPLISKVQGRVADFLVTPEGRLVSGVSLTDHFVGRIPGVSQVQIIQDEADHLLLNVVRGGEGAEKTERVIAALVGEFFGPRMRFDVRHVEAIPQEPSGKFRFTINRMKHDLF